MTRTNVELPLVRPLLQLAADAVGAGLRRLSLEIFHFADSPCDRVSFISNFDRIFFTEAVGQNLRPCSACARSLVDGPTAALPRVFTSSRETEEIP